MVQNRVKGVNPDPGSNMLQVLNILGKAPEKKYFSGKYYEEILVTPKQAEKLLEFNSKKNRRQSNRRVISLRKNIEEYGYHSTNPISFDENWNIADGQHRTRAISQLKNNIAFPILFAFNIPEDDISFIDMGMNRTVSHQLEMMGIENGNFIHPILKGALKGQSLRFKDRSAWDKASNLYEPSQLFSAKDVEQIYYDNKEAFDFVVNLFCSQSGWVKKKKNDAIKGAFFRAWHHENREMLKEFVRIYKGDFRQNEDPRHMALIGAFERKVNSKECEGRQGSIFTYSVTEKAIHLFCALRGKKIPNNPRINPFDYEIYPLPTFDRRPPGKVFEDFDDLKEQIEG